MRHTFELSSAKYYAPIQAQQAEEARQARHRKAIYNFASLGLLAIALGVLSSHTLPQWLPLVQTALASFGVKL